MNKNFLFFLFWIPFHTSMAASQVDALKAREEALHALKGFNPAAVLKDYTINPKESALQPQEGTNNLPSLGVNALNSNQSAHDIYKNAGIRVKVRPNPNSDEMRYAENLLKNPETVLKGGEIACANGECDSSLTEKSDDLKEGLSRLGALGGAAGDVSIKQVQSGVPAIFAGTNKECKKYPLGFRDCCKDSGWGDWIKHCPPDLQALQRAKHEKRVIYLGNYKNHKFGSRRYTYCIFPSKLAAIIQIQGRGKQLRIPYGSAKYPNCRGITPQELERINFSALNLSSLQQELMARMALPVNGQIGAYNKAKVERMSQEGRAHD